MGISSWRLLVAVPFVALFASSACAGGLWIYEMGAPEMGVAEAGRAAMATDASTAFGNPAGMTRLEGFQILVGLTGSLYTLTFDKGSDTNVKGNGSGDAGGLMPGGGIFCSASLSPNWRLGVTLGSYAGGAVNYDDHWYGRYYCQSSSLLTFALNPSLSYRLTDWLSLGAGFTVMYGELKQKAAINNNILGRSDYGDGQLKIEDKEFGLGGNVGVWIEPLEGTRLGLTYRSEIELEFQDVPELEDLAPWLSDLLGRSGGINNKMDLSVTLPQEVLFSVYQEFFSKKLAIMGSVGWQDWSQFSDVSVAVSAERIGKSFGLKTKFQDTWHYAIGAQYRIGKPWLLSVGFAYDTSPFDKTEYRPLSMPLDRQIRYAAGLQYDWTKAVTVGIAYTYLDAGDAKIDREFPILGKVEGDFSSNYAHLVAFNLTWRF